MTRRPSVRVLRAVNWVLLVVGAAAIVVMMIHIVVNALLRSVNNSPLTGTNELVAYWYMPLVGFIGFIVAQRDRSHTEARVLFDRLPTVSRQELHVAGLLLAAAMCAGFAYFGFQEATHNQEIGLTDGVTGVPIWPSTYLVPVTYAVLAVQMLTEMVLTVRRPARVDTLDEEAADAGV